MLHPRALYAAMPLAILSLATLAPAADIPAAWDGASARWSDAAHWSSPQYPNNDSPPGATYDVTIAAGQLDLSSLAPTVNAFAWSGGTLTTTFIDRNGDTVIGGMLTVNNTALLSGSLTLNRAFLTLNGQSSVGVSAPLQLVAQNDAQLFNAGTLTLGAQAAFAGQPLHLTNTGLLEFTPSSDTALSLLAVQNNGTVHLHAGTLYTSMDTHTGSFSIDAGATLNIPLDTLPTALFTSTSSITGQGNLVAGNANIQGAFSVTGNITANGRLRFFNPVTLSSATISGGGLVSSSSLAVTGLLTWNGGGVAATGGFTANGGAALTGAGTVGGVFTSPLGKTFTFGNDVSNTSLALTTATSFFNAGTFNASAGSITSIGDTTPSTFTNSGTFNVSAPGGALTITDSGDNNFVHPLTFNNSGIVNLNSGTLNLVASDNGSTTGAFHLTAATTLNIGGRYTFAAGSTLDGAGDVFISIENRRLPSQPPLAYGGADPLAVAFNGGYAVTGGLTIRNIPVTFNTNTTIHDLILESATFGGSGTLTLTGTSTWKHAALNSPAIIVDGSLAATADTTATVPCPYPTLDGTAMTITSTGSLAIAGTDTFLFKNNASLTNNGVVSAGNPSSFNPALAISATTTNGGIFTNNGTLNLYATITISSSLTFINNGTINLNNGTFQRAASGTDGASSALNIAQRASYLTSTRSFTAGALSNGGSITISAGTATVTFGSSLAFRNTGMLVLRSGTLLLAAAQDPLTTGQFDVRPVATLEFAANYDFSSPAGPTLTGSGLLIVDADTTLTLPVDTAFTGTIQVDGQLIIAPALNPANIDMTPNFTILPAAVPEPASLTLLALALPLLRKRRPRPTPNSTH